MTGLLDVNVLVALAWPNHVHHAAAARWFIESRDDGWATCPVTESGFVRISSNPRISRGDVSPATAISLLSELRRSGHHEFWTDPVSIVDHPAVPRERLHGHRQVTDAHLLALATLHDGHLVTFDRGVQELGRPERTTLLRG